MGKKVSLFGCDLLHFGFVFIDIAFGNSNKLTILHCESAILCKKRTVRVQKWMISLLYYLFIIFAFTNHFEKRIIMKKNVLIILCCFLSYNINAQEAKEKKFTHSLTENFGTILKFQLDNMPNYPALNGDYSFLNLIPSYEFGYNNKVFFRLKFRNLENESNSFEIYRRFDAYSIVLNYNLLKRNSKHSFKIGTGYVLGHYHDKTFYEYNEEINYNYGKDIENHLLFTLSYLYKIDNHLSFGIEADFYDVLMYREYSVAIRYTF